MSRSKIIKLFLSSIVACITGGILVAIAVAAFPTDVFVMNGSNIVAVHGSATAWAILALGAVGALILVGAAVAGFAAWIGALLNTATLERKRWFVALALFGVFNCGLLGVFIYVVGRPDRGTVARDTVDAGTPVASAA